VPASSPPAGRERAATTVGLVAVTLAGLIMFGVGLAGSISFFGQGAEEAFRRWTDQALLWGGAVAVVSGCAGIAVAWLSWLSWLSWPGGRAGGWRGRPGVRRSGVAAAALVAVVAVAAGIVVHHERSEPQGNERSALEHLVVAPGATITDHVTTGSLPAGDATVAGPSGLGPPAGVRSWQPSDCASLDRTLSAWADEGSVQVPRSFVAGAGTPVCLWFATYHGWSVRAEVLGSASGGRATARVVIAPPGVGL